MKTINNFEEIPYPIGLVKEIASIKFNEDATNNLKLFEAIVMCNIIRGIIEADDHYVLMPKSIEYYEAIKKYGVETLNIDVEEFKERKQNRIDRHRKGLIDTPLGMMETWYCDDTFARIMRA